MANNIISDKRLWVIMSKDRTLIAKGSPRDRNLVRVDDVKDNKRLLTYTTKNKAQSAFKISGFYGQSQLKDYQYGVSLSEYLEAVEVSFKVEII